MNPPNAAEPRVHEIRVKVADYAVGSGNTLISTIGLGSCVAIMLYDGSSRIGEPAGKMQKRWRKSGAGEVDSYSAARGTSLATL